MASGMWESTSLKSGAAMPPVKEPKPDGEFVSIVSNNYGNQAIRLSEIVTVTWPEHEEDYNADRNNRFAVFITTSANSGHYQYPFRDYNQAVEMALELLRLINGSENIEVLDAREKP